MSEQEKQEVQELFEYAQRLVYPIESELKEAYWYTEASKGFEKIVQNQRTLREFIYDSTATECVSDLQTNIMSLLIPSSERWAEIGFATQANDVKWGAQFAKSIDAANEVLFEHFSYSNFYSAYGEALQDGIIGGTACLAIINRPGHPICYMPIPLQELYFTEDFDGTVCNVFRKHTRTTSQLESQFGYIPDVIATESSRGTQEHELVEAALTDPVTGKTTYTIYYMKNWEPLVEPTVSRYKTFHVWRWGKSTGNVWGESPVRRALPIIKTLNVMVQCTLAFGEYASQGLWQYDGEITNVDNLRSKMRPGSIVAVEGGELKPVPFPGQFNIGQELISDARQQVRSLMLNKPQRDVNKTPITAEQVTTDRDTFFKLIGEPARRMNDESLQPIAEHVFGLLCERGDIQLATHQQIKAIDPTATSVTDVFHVESNAAITKVLKIQEAQQSIQAVQAMVQAVGEQLAFQIIDIPALAREQVVNLGLSRRFLRSEKDAAAIAKQQQQAAQQQQTGDQVTEFAKTAAKTPAGQNAINAMLSNAAALHDTRTTVNASQNILAS